MRAQTVTVTDAQRIAHTIKQLGRWASNYDANADHATQEGRHTDARHLRMKANNCRDTIEMLDGTEDSYISALLKAGE